MRDVRRIVQRLVVINVKEMQGNIWVYLGYVIGENHFHNCVHESERALLVAVSTKEIMVDHKCGN